MKTTIQCMFSGLCAGMTVATVVIFSGNQSKHLPLLYGVTGIAGLMGSLSTLVVVNDEKPTKERLLKLLKTLRLLYASSGDKQNQLVKIAEIEEDLWRL